MGAAVLGYLSGVWEKSRPTYLGPGPDVDCTGAPQCANRGGSTWCGYFALAGGSAPQIEVIEA